MTLKHYKVENKILQNFELTNAETLSCQSLLLIFFYRRGWQNLRNMKNVAL